MRSAEPGAADMSATPITTTDVATAASSAPELPMTRRRLRELERMREQAEALRQRATEAPSVEPALVASVVTEPAPTVIDTTPAVIGAAPAVIDAAPAVIDVAPSVFTVSVPSAPEPIALEAVVTETTVSEIVVPIAETEARSRRVASPGPRRRTRTAPARPASRRSRRAASIVRKVTSATALLFVGALFVGTTLPANAFRSETFVAEATAKLEPAAQELQLADSESAVAAAVSGRDDYTVTTLSQMLRQKYGTRSYNYTTSGSGPVRWPFPYAVPVSSGFGERAAPCRGCSSDHKGLDLTPGLGTPIYAIADGVVTAQAESGGFGNHVFIEHTINGQKVETRYAHMGWGTSPLRPGDTIAVGEFVGLVGSTGQSTGPHLHLEVLVNGSHVDPFVWLTANAS